MPEVRLITPITRQSTKKMQVAAYCRVSSNSADQLNSYAAQIRAYKKCIGARDDWELVDIFADEGLTGMKSETRDEFQRMIRMCELKQIDLIITKSISRFARNTKDALAYVRKLKLLGVGVQFEKEGISTLSMGDEMLLNTFSALAQEESQSISMNQRLSIVKRMELGEYVDSNAPYGYRLVDKALAVYEPEAAVVRDIFDLYLRGFSISEIGRELKSRNIPTKAGKESWHPYRIAYMLKNERYIGDSFYQKTYSIAITYDVSPTPPTWDTFANSLLCLDGRLEMWKLMQESWPHHKAVEAQKGVSKMSTSYFIFTEVLANDQWHCINPQVMKLLPIEHLILVPTLRSDSRYQFEKAYRQLECDGHPFTVDEMSRNLQASVNDWLTPEDSVRIAVCYDDILKLLNTSGKEHSAFALRSEVAAFQNDESDSILDFVSVDEYRKMEDELKKAYQYFEWNDRSGAYRYYEKIQKKVAAQVKDWKAINPRAEITSVRIMLFST